MSIYVDRQSALVRDHGISLDDRDDRSALARHDQSAVDSEHQGPAEAALRHLDRPIAGDPRLPLRRSRIRRSIGDHPSADRDESLASSSDDSRPYREPEPSDVPLDPRLLGEAP
jgi:hypothetical protein